MPSVGPYRFSDTDVLRTFSNLGSWWDHVVGGIDAAPAIAVAERLADSMAATLSLEADRSPAVARLERLGLTAADRFAGSASGPDAVALLTTVWNSMSEAFAVLRRTGTVATDGHGSVARLNVSAGGVPKRAIDSAEVDFGGVVGDKQGARVHHGRPWQALCLWSAEVIDEFAAGGHPIGMGSAGENITVRGIPWADVRPGVRLRIGSVLAEATAWAIPCRHNAQWFIGGEFMLMSHERGPVSRIYATVVEPGRIATGDRIDLTT
jgi:MOSC domain-containing protein YiiM